MAKPLVKGVEAPFAQPFLVRSFSGLLGETEGLFLAEVEEGEMVEGRMWMGRSSIPVATRFSIRPPKMSRVPGEGGSREAQS